MKSGSKNFFIAMIVVNMAVLFLVGATLTFTYLRYKNTIESKGQLATEFSKLSELESLKNLVDETRDQRLYLEGLFVDKEKIIDFLGFIESLKKSSGADVEVVSVNEGSLDSGDNFITIRFEAGGSWSQVLKTVKLVDHIPMAFFLTGLEISKGSIGESKSSKIAEWRAVFEAKVLKLP